jgi:soluble cytochrome b562
LPPEKFSRPHGKSKQTKEKEGSMNELKQHVITALDLAQTHLDEGNIEGALICQQGALRQVAALLGGETETTVLEGATVDCDE